MSMLIILYTLLMFLLHFVRNCMELYNLILFWSTAEHGHNSSITPCMIMKLTLMFKPATDLECIHV